MRPIFSLSPVVLGLFFLLSPLMALADTDVDEILDVFESPESQMITEAREGLESPTEPESYPVSHLSGTVQFFTSYGLHSHTPSSSTTNYRGLTSLRSGVNLNYDVKLNRQWQARLSGHGFYDAAYSLRNRANFTDEVLDLYEKELELDEGYVSARLTDSLDFRLGRQIVVWGKADFLRVVDVLNPIDNREPGLVDEEHTSLPVFMSRLDYYLNNWRFTGIILHEYRNNKDPAYGNDFYPFTFPPPPYEKVSSDLGSQGFFLAFGNKFYGWDVTLHAASFLREQQLIGLSEAISARKINRHTLIGIAGDTIKNDWVFKFETAYLDGLKYYALPDTEESRMDFLAGLEYTGLPNTRIHLEVLYQYTYNLDQSGVDQFDLPKRNTLVWVLQLSRSFYHDRLKIYFRSFNLGIDLSDGSAQKFWITYALTDHFSCSGGLVDYHSGDNYFMKDIGKNDRLFFTLKYSF